MKMVDDKLDESNFLLFAAKHYDNPSCWDTLEFYEDLNRIKYIKKLFTRYKESGKLKERLIINHLIILNNVFGVGPTQKMLFLKLNGYYEYLKPFLEYMGICPVIIKNIGITNNDINVSEIKSDIFISGILKELR